MLFFKQYFSIVYHPYFYNKYFLKRIFQITRIQTMQIQNKMIDDWQIPTTTLKYVQEKINIENKVYRGAWMVLFAIETSQEIRIR